MLRLLLWLFLLLILHVVLRMVHEPYRLWARGVDRLVKLLAIGILVSMVINMIYLFFVRA